MSTETPLTMTPRDPPEQPPTLPETHTPENIFAGAGSRRLTPEQERILQEPLPQEKLRINPSGNVYLPHQDYRRILNRAFGIGGWALVPLTEPVTKNDAIIREFALIAEGRFLSCAYSGRKIKNKKQLTIDDTIEGTKSSVFTRVGKDIGIGLELWDKGFQGAWKNEYAETYKNDEGTFWRMKSRPDQPSSQKSTDKQPAQPTQKPLPAGLSGMEHKATITAIKTESEHSRSLTLVLYEFSPARRPTIQVYCSEKNQKNEARGRDPKDIINKDCKILFDEVTSPTTKKKGFLLRSLTFPRLSPEEQQRFDATVKKNGATKAGALSGEQISQLAELAIQETIVYTDLNAWVISQFNESLEHLASAYFAVVKAAIADGTITEWCIAQERSLPPESSHLHRY